MNDRHLLVGDREREEATTVLGEHLVHGRLTGAEHGERIEAVWRARTRGELRESFGDLPGPDGRPVVPRGPSTLLPWAVTPLPRMPAPPPAPAARRVPRPVVGLLLVAGVLTVATDLRWLVALVVLWVVVARRDRPRVVPAPGSRPGLAGGARRGGRTSYAAQRGRV